MKVSQVLARAGISLEQFALCKFIRKDYYDTNDEKSYGSTNKKAIELAAKYIEEAYNNEPNQTKKQLLKRPLKKIFSKVIFIII